MQKVKNLIIIAGGDATRLLKFHQNVIPKILLNVDTETVLAKMLNFWQPRVEYFHIVLKSQKEIRQVGQYIELVFPHLRGKFFFYVMGSEKHTMSKLARVADFSSGNAYITWSDIWPEDIDEHQLDRNYIIGDVEPRHRFHYHTGIISECSKPNGNLCGLFYIRNIEVISDISDYYRINYNLDEVDFTQVLKTLIDNAEIGDEEFLLIEAKIQDVGDFTKLQNTKANFNLYKNKFRQARYFQQIEILETEVIKSSTHEKGQKLIESEIDYYDFIEKNEIHDLFPKKLSNSSDYDSTKLVLERIQGRTIFEHLQSIDSGCTNIHLAKNIFTKFQLILSDLHMTWSKKFNATNYEIFQLDRMHEYFQVTSNRLRSVEPFIENIKIANFKPLDEVDILLSKISIFVENSNYKMCYGIIHGDTNTSNVMIDESTEKLKLIDPRGTFGHSKFLGDKNYDIAKFLYGLSGYDNFNTIIDLNFKFDDIEHSEIIYQLPPHYDLDLLTDDVELKILVSIIWLKLSAYIINDPIKCMIAYSHGSILFNKYFKEFINKTK